MWWHSSRTIKNLKGWCHQHVAFNKSANREDPIVAITGKGQFSSQFPRKVILKNVLTIRQLRSSPILVSLCLKSCMLDFSILWTRNFQMSKLGLKKEEEPEIKLPIFPGSLWLCSPQQNSEKFLKRWEKHTTWPASWEICMQVRK